MENSSSKLSLKLLQLKLHLHSQLGQGVDGGRSLPNVLGKTAWSKCLFSLKKREKQIRVLLYIEYINPNL